MDTDLAFRALSLSLGMGLLLTVAARKFELPTIVLLFAGGVLLGPEGLGWVQPESLGALLPVVVSLSIGIILFEGGLTLNPRDYLVSPTIIKMLLTVGAMVTWLVAAGAVWLAFGASWQISLLAGSLVIVTGPTVIVPLLHRLRLAPRLGSILLWEGVLIDAVGVFIAVFCYELVVLEGGGAAVTGLFLRLAVGLALGIVGGLTIQTCLERRWVPEALNNPFALAAAVLIFASAEFISHESGLLAVTVAGVIVGRRRSSEVRQIQAFKAEMTDLLIGTLFLLLVSRLDLALFLEDIWPLALAVAIVMFVGRPLNVAVSSIGSGLSGRERLFLAWVAPRGIVAASMASLFALQLADVSQHAEEAILLEKFVYTVICATVVLQGLSAGWWARLLGVARPEPNGWLIVGAHRFGREVGRALRDRELDVLLVDSNQRNVAAAEADGLKAVLEDARDADSLRDDERFQNAGNLLSLTDNVDLNELVAAHWRPFFGKDRLFAWAPSAATRNAAMARPVFQDLPRPSLVAEELEKGLARVGVSEGEAPEGAFPLLALKENKAAPVSTSDDFDGGSIFWLRRQSNLLDRAVDRGGIVEVEASDLLAAYQALCDEALLREPRLDRDQLRQELALPEHHFLPQVGEGVSALHIYSDVLERSLCLATQLDTPVPVAGGRRSANWVFLVIGPVEDPEETLGVMAELAHLCHDPERLERWAENRIEQDGG